MRGRCAGPSLLHGAASGPRTATAGFQLVSPVGYVQGCLSDLLSGRHDQRPPIRTDARWRGGGQSRADGLVLVGQVDARVADGRVVGDAELGLALRVLAEVSVAGISAATDLVEDDVALVLDEAAVAVVCVVSLAVCPAMTHCGRV